jgi:hypothetical protein
LNDFARVEASIPPCSMLRMIDLSRTRTFVSSTFCTIFKKSVAVVSVVTFVSSFLALSLLFGEGDEMVGVEAPDVGVVLAPGRRAVPVEVRALDPLLELPQVLDERPVRPADALLDPLVRLSERPRAIHRMYAAMWYTEVFRLSPTRVSAQDFTVLKPRVGSMSS